MARYYFDLRNTKFRTVDEDGTECSDREAVSAEALQLLCVVAKDHPLDHMHNQLAAIVRDETGKVVLTATVGLSTTWIDEA